MADMNKRRTVDESEGDDTPVIAGQDEAEVVVDEADFNTFTFGLCPVGVQIVGGPYQEAQPGRLVTSEDYLDRQLLSRLADDGGCLCGEVDEIDWPAKYEES